MKKYFKIDWQYLVKTAIEVVRDSIGLYNSIVNDDVQWLLIYLLVISVRLFLIVTLLDDYWKLHKLENEVNFMEYFKESFREQIVRHHICYNN